MKKSMVLVLAVLLGVSVLSANPQTLTQIGFVVKQALPATKTIVVFYPESMKAGVIKEATTAQVVTKKTFQVYDIKFKTDLASQLFNIPKFEDPVVVVLTDDASLSRKSVKFIVDKLAGKGVPIITNRSMDTLQGAFMSIFMEGTTLSKHINKIVASALSIKPDPEYMKGCVVDVE